MSLGYAYEKLYVAVLEMAASPRCLRRRIADAYVGGLISIDTRGKGSDLPIDLQPALEQIKAALDTADGTGGQGRAEASALAMSDDTVEETARKITWLFDQVSARTE